MEAQERKERIMAKGPSAYGGKYWCVKVTKDVSPSGEIYVNADSLHYPDSGALEFVGAFREFHGEPREERITNLAVAPGKWLAAYAASCFDGSAVAVDHWQGEVIDEK